MKVVKRSEKKSQTIYTSTRAPKQRPLLMNDAQSNLKTVIKRHKKSHNFYCNCLMWKRAFHFYLNLILFFTTIYSLLHRKLCVCVFFILIFCFIC